MMRGLFILILALALLSACFSCGGEQDLECDQDDATDAGSLPAGDDPGLRGGDDDLIGDDDNSEMNDAQRREKLLQMLKEMGFDPFLDVKYTRTEPGFNGYTNYYFSLDDCRCYNGKEAHVSVSPGTSNNVMLFMEGGGASWPGGGFAVSIDYPFDISYKNRDPENPLRDWHFVYVPYCDNSIHTGNNTIMRNGKLRYHWGMRHTAAAVALIKELFPNPDKILVTGASAGGFGTYLGWGMIKYAFFDTDTYILSDSGVGFWNPEEVETWEAIKKAWALNIPSECTKCKGTMQTFLYELYLKYDPQLRVGMFTAYQDAIISGWFLKMDPIVFEDTLMAITDEIKQSEPKRLNRFFIQGRSHTAYEFLLREGASYSVDGTSLYDWIGQLVYDDPAWSDKLE